MRFTSAPFVTMERANPYSEYRKAKVKRVYLFCQIYDYNSMLYLDSVVDALNQNMNVSAPTVAQRAAVAALSQDSKAVSSSSAKLNICCGSSSAWQPKLENQKIIFLYLESHKFRAGERSHQRMQKLRIRSRQQELPRIAKGLLRIQDLA